MSTDTGAQLLDVREPAECAHGHMAGSINVGLSGQYATWAGTLLASDRPIVIVANPGREEEAATRLGRIGFDTVAGYLDGGMQALEARPDLVVVSDSPIVAIVSRQRTENRQCQKDVISHRATYPTGLFSVL